MTETITPSADARRWAKGKLGFDKLPEPPDTAAVLRAVTKAGYVLSAEAAEAAQVIANPSVENLTAEQRGRELRLAQAVSEFANTFFEIPPEQRVEKWKVLSDECSGIPSLFRWLDQLAIGLQIAEAPTLANSRMNELIKISCKVFTAKPPGRIRQRQQFLASIGDDQDDFAVAVEALKSQSPEFVSRIAPWLEVIPKAEIPGRDEAAQLRALHEQKSGKREYSNTTEDFAPKWVFLFGFFALNIVLAAIRHAQTGGEPVYVPPVAPRPQYNSPSLPPAPSQTPPNKLKVSPEDLERLLGEKNRSVKPATIHPTEVQKINK